MMLDDEYTAIQQDQEMMMPATSPHDPLTYDPTQGAGTSGWQDAVRKQAELNARLRRN